MKMSAQTDTVIEHMNDVFALLKNPNVRAMLSTLRAHGGTSVTMLTVLHRMSQPNVSFYLRRLKRANVVNMTRDGARHIYYIADTPEARFVKLVLDYLHEVGAI
jgi:DNA-binding transcriptional ArsR family regulator